MWIYDLQVNGQYRVCFFSPDGDSRVYKIIYQKRRWIAFKNKFKNFWNQIKRFLRSIKIRGRFI